MSQEQRRPQPGGMQGGGPMGRGGWGAMGMPVQKAKDFKGTAKRLLGYFIPQKYLLIVVFVTAVLGTVFNIVGPKILGLATTKLFDGLDVEFIVQSHIFPGCDNWAERGLVGRLFRDTMHVLESSPLRRFGISHFVVARKRA